MVGSGSDNDGHGGSGSTGGSGDRGSGNGHRPSDRPGANNWNNPNKNEDRYGGNRYGPGGNRIPADIPGSSDGYGRPPYDRYPDSGPGDYGIYGNDYYKVTTNF